MPPLPLICLSREVQGVVDERILGESIDQPVVGPGCQQILSVFFLGLGEVIERERQPRIARRQVFSDPGNAISFYIDP